MEKTLKQNDHKGGWESCSLGYLITRLAEEVRESWKNKSPADSLQQRIVNVLSEKPRTLPTLP
ncbi:hypothetical protein BBO01nite_49900 [Brevibacillus borstelensis]|nr:hypothetical protein BBO01nite_49900 [Brevibacillus borstelensis]